MRDESNFPQTALATAYVIVSSGNHRIAACVPAQCAMSLAGSSPAQPSAEEAETTRLTDDELEVLVARIALYPDELVAAISAASLFPLQIVEAQRFLEAKKKNSDLKPKERLGRKRYIAAELSRYRQDDE